MKEAWRRFVLSAIVLGSLAFALTRDPLRQDVGYHRFADLRTLFGVPNFMDVGSNVAFLLVGVAGVAFLARRPAGPAWLTFFIGVALVSAGSGYYHASPSNATLLWDRLPITVAFMGLFAATVGEYVEQRLGGLVLLPAVLLGVLSVLYWHWFDDLRFYLWISLLPLLTIPASMILFRPRHTRQWLLLAALGLYGLAKASEVHDREIYAYTRQLLSGHTLKHLLAALSCLTVLAMLRWRQPVPKPDVATQ